MEREDKELLLKDLCARLPYGVKAKYYGSDEECECWDTIEGIYPMDDEIVIGQYGLSVDMIKPYLFPLSSMTEEQKKEYNRWKHEVPVCHYEYGDVVEELELFDSPESFEYLIENHFDYRGLIPKGLANDATGLNIY